MSSARAALRDATAADHNEVDALYSRFDLSERQGYGRFLLAQATAYLPVEAGIERRWAPPDWQPRTSFLLTDLDALELAVPTPLVAADLENEARTLGALYVLEGSRLGGRLLSRGVDRAFPTGFLKACSLPWPRYLEFLEERLYEPGDRLAAIEAARRVFGLFGQAAEAQLGIVRTWSH